MNRTDKLIAGEIKLQVSLLHKQLEEMQEDAAKIQEEKDPPRRKYCEAVGIGKTVNFLLGYTERLQQAAAMLDVEARPDFNFDYHYLQHLERKYRRRKKE